jgi:hypothetical protein
VYKFEILFQNSIKTVKREEFPSPRNLKRWYLPKKNGNTGGIKSSSCDETYLLLNNNKKWKKIKNNKRNKGVKTGKTEEKEHKRKKDVTRFNKLKKTEGKHEREKEDMT